MGSSGPAELTPSAVLGLAPGAEGRRAAWAAAARRRAAFRPEGLPPAEVPADGSAEAGGASSGAVSHSRDTSLARIAALTDIFEPAITLARRSARPASGVARRTAGRPGPMMLACPFPQRAPAVRRVTGEDCSPYMVANPP